MEHLRRRLAELHRELERTDALDGESRAALEEVLRDIQELLARSGGTQREPATLADRLLEAGRHFEDSHPTLTATLGRVVDALVALGI
jgi:hypothetical protein